jgi:acetyltransferase-like isoleucine patch superfamily enzyme
MANNPQAPKSFEIEWEDDQLIRIRLTQATCDALSRLNIFNGYSETYLANSDQTIQIPKSAEFEEWTNPGLLFYSVGAFSYSESGPLDATIGRYCSISSGVQIFGERHPIERVTSSSITYCFLPHWNKPQFLRAHRMLMGSKHLPDFDKLEKAAPIIEHDVWIGQNAQLARGITIGTGAVIAAGAVVTKDVIPYTIVGGNPAKAIRDRFPKATAKQLLATKWWTYNPDILWQLGYETPEKFCSRFDEAIKKNELIKHQFRRLTWRDVVAEIEMSVR